MNQTLMHFRFELAKCHEIAGQMFDNEYGLTVIEGMEARSQAGNCPLERFIFNCA
jgi:hypothetical protein